MAGCQIRGAVGRVRDDGKKKRRPDSSMDQRITRNNARSLGKEPERLYSLRVNGNRPTEYVVLFVRLTSDS